MSWLPGTTVTSLGRTQSLEPRVRRLVLAGQPEIDEIAGDGDMVRPLRLEIGDHEIEAFAAMHARAAALPVEISQSAFDVEVAQGETAHRGQMDVRYLCKRERVGHRSYCGRGGGANSYHGRH